MKRGFPASVIPVAIFLLIVAMIPPASAAAPASVTEPFITIDPIGNHTAGVVFFINGTTNLGRWENTLDLDIEWWAFNPAGRWSPMYITNASIQPVGNGTGIWSAEILPAQWEMYTDVEHRTTVFCDAGPGEYVAYAESTSPLGPAVLSQQTFFVVPPETTSTPGLSNITPLPESGGTGIATSPTRQAAPLPGIVPVIAIVAGMIFLASFTPKKRK